MFRIVVGVLGLILVFFHIFLYKRHKKRWGSYKWFSYFRIFYWLLALPGVVFLISGAILGRTVFAYPVEKIEPLYYIPTAVNYAHIFLFPFYFICLFILHLFLVFPRKLFTKKEEKTEAISRRDFLTKTTALAFTTLDSLPLSLSLFSLGGMFLGSKEILIEKVQIPIKNLPKSFQGLRIVQISDIHIGNLIHEKYLSYAGDLIKQIPADVLVVTGDIIDNNNYFLPLAQRFFASLKDHFPFGMFGILGNHDLIMDGEEVAQKLTLAGLRMLRNETITLRRGKDKLNLMGLDFPPVRRASHHARIKYMEQYYRKAKKDFPEGYPLIVLNHHPSDFIILQQENIDLVLSGHTHGGQFIFSSNRESPLSLASNWYRYYIGHYEENGRHLYVNRGLGHWFPLRINCPPEITVIELV